MLHERTNLPHFKLPQPGILHHPSEPMACEVPVPNHPGEECGQRVVAVAMRKLQGKHRTVASYCQDHIIEMAAEAAEVAKAYAESMQGWLEFEREAWGAPPVEQEVAPAARG